MKSIENWNPTKITQDQSNRVSSITKQNRQFLNDIGVWNHVESNRVRDVKQMQVWDGLSDARIQFNSNNNNSDSMATLIENLNLQRATLKRIKQLNGDDCKVELIDRMKVKEIIRDTSETGGGWPIVKLENSDGTLKRSIRARLLIGADGVNSPVKTFSDIETFGWNYDRQGVVSSLNLQPSGGSGTFTAWQRFLPQGPIALLPLSDTTASLVWSTTPEFSNLLKALPTRVFSILINLAFCLPYSQLYSLLDHLYTLHSTKSLPESESLISSLQQIYQTHVEETYSPNSSPPDPLPPQVTSIQPNSTASFPLRLSHTSSYLGLPSPSGSGNSPQDLRTVLIGDAAHTIHPLAGQGLNLGLQDAFSLVRVLERSVEKGLDLGSFVGLLQYPRERYFKNHTLLSACDHLNSLYSSENKLVVWARSNGLEVVNELEGLKSLLMGEAGGGGGANTSTSGGAGGWGFVASTMESLGKVKDLVGFASGVVGGIVKKRATEFVVKGR